MDRANTAWLKPAFFDTEKGIKTNTPGKARSWLVRLGMVLGLLGLLSTITPAYASVITITDTQNNSHNGDAFDVTVTASVAPARAADLALNDFALTNAMASNLRVVSATQITATITPTNRYLPVTIEVRAGAFTDTNGDQSQRASKNYPYTGPPSPPRNLRAVAGPASVTLTWDAPLYVGGRTGTIDSYYYSIAGVGVSVQIPGGAGARRVVVPNLTPGQNYDFIVVAFNPRTSLPSNTASATPAAAAVVPNAPTNLTATAGNTTVKLDWDNPGAGDNGGSAITDYEVSSDDGTNWTSTTSTDSSVNVTGLTNGTEYTFRVRAVNAVGNSAASASVLATPDGTRPTVVITTDADAGSHNGDAFTATFTFSEDVVGFTSVDIGLLEGRIGLILGRDSFRAVSPQVYTVSIIPSDAYRNVVINVNANVAQDGASNGNTAAVQVTVPHAAPSAPSNLQARAGDTQVTLSWQAPARAGAGAPITGYQYRQQAGAGARGNWQNIPNSAPGGANEASYTVTGLTNNTGYFFEVRAVNTGGGVLHEGDSISLVRRVTPIPAVADNTPPTVTISTPKPSHNGQAFIATFSFSEDVTGFTEDDITTGNATSDNFTRVAADRYTVRVTPNSPYVPVTIDVPANAFQDLATNPNTAPATQVIVHGGPSAPQNVNIQAGDRQVTITWDEPSYTSTGIDSYWYRIDGGAQQYIGDGTSRRVTILNLVNGQSYRFEVKAHSLIGVGTVAGQYSVAISATPATVPSAPANLTATAGDTTVKLDWNDPGAGDDGGSAITGYQYRQQIGANAFGAWGNIPGSDVNTRSYTVTGLANNTAYTFEVRAVNAIGNGAASNQASATPAVAVVDNTAPTVTITPNNLDGNSHNGQAFNVDIEFSEAVVGFVQGDIQVGNGAVTGFNAGRAPIYVVEITPDAPDLDVTIDIDAGVAQDGATNQNLAAVQAVIPHGPPSAPRNLRAQAGDGQVTLSWQAPARAGAGAPITGYQYRQRAGANAFGAWLAVRGSDVNTRSYAVTGLTNNTRYTFEVRAVNNGDSTTGVAASVSETPAAADVTAPTVVITTDADAGSHNGDAFTATFTFNEDVVGFVVGDIRVTGGAADNFVRTSARVYTATITPTDAYTNVAIDVNANVAQDGATNDNEAARQLIVPHAAPTAPRNFQAQAGDTQVTLSWQAPVRAGSTAITGYQYRQQAGAGVWSNWQNIPNSAAGGANEASYTVTGLTNNTAYTFEVRAVNRGGGVLHEGDSISLVRRVTPVAPDVTPPTVAITTDAGASHDGNTAFIATFTFSELLDPADAFAEGDITLTNADASNFAATTANRIYTATITPNADANITIDVGPGVVADPAGNANTAAVQVSVPYADTTPPTVTINLGVGEALNHDGSTRFGVGIVFSEDLDPANALALGDIRVTNGVASTLVAALANRVYTIFVTPNAAADITIDVGPGVVADPAGNDNTAATQLIIPYVDTTDPTVVITTNAENGSHNGTAFTATFTFNEDVVGFVVGDIRVAGGAADNFVRTSARVYTATITPTDAYTNVAIDVNVGAAQDGAANDNEAAVQVIVRHAAPTAPRNFQAQAGDTQVTLSWQAPVRSGSTAITGYQYRQNDGAGFGAWQVIPNSAPGGANDDSFTVTGLTNNTAYSFEIQAVNAGFNSGQPSASASATPIPAAVDNTPPTVTITTSHPSHNGIHSLTATFTFSEPLNPANAFALGDITVTNANASNLVATTANRVYTATIAPISAYATVTIDVGPGVVQDVADNLNTAATQVIVHGHPSAPQNVRTQAGDTQVTLTWDPPAYTSTGIVSYHYRIDGGAAQRIGDGTSRSVTIPNLVNGQSYRFEVRADSQIGGTTLIGQYSAAQSATPATVPSAPANLTATAGDTTVQLDWDNPGARDDGGSAITRYEVSRDNGNWSSTSSTDSSFNVTGLTNGTRYTFRVRAVNAIGNSAASASVPATPMAADTDDPTVVITTNADAGSHNGTAFTATFTFNEDVVGFVVGDIRVAGGAADNFVRTSARVYTARITPTDAYTNVAIDVNAGVAQDGATNDNEAAVQVIVLHAAPTAPRNFQAQAGDTQVTLSWQAPVRSGSSAITGYEYRQRAGVGAWGNWQNIPTSAPGQANDDSFTVTGLTNNTAYSFEIQAVNAGFHSGQSSASDSATPAVGAADTVSPTVTITTPARSNNGNAFTVTFTFSEVLDPANTFALGDITLTNARASNLVATTANRVYTATITPISRYDSVTIDVAGGVVADPASNANLDAAQFVLYGGPSAPQNVRAQAGDRQVTLTWDEPSYTSNGIGFYWYRIDGRNPRRIGDGTSRSVTISGLVNGQSYRFEVQADSSIIYPGSGEEVFVGQYSAAQSATPATVPSAPANLTATAGDTTVKLDWDDPRAGDNGGSAITDYEVSRDNGNWSSTSSTDSSFNVTGLTNGTRYTFRVRAVNAIGNSAASASVSATPMAADNDDPTVVITTDAEDGSHNGTVFTATFTFNEDVVNFVIGDIGVTGGAASNFVRTSARVYTATITPTDAYTNVAIDVNVGAAQDGATNDNEAARQLIVRHAAPTAPRNFQAQAGDTQVTLSWQAPVRSGSSAITGYQYRQQAGGGAWGNWQNIPTSAPGQANDDSFTVTGLTNNTAYTFEVRAVNTSGLREGQSSASASATPMAVVVDNTAPTVTITPNNLDGDSHNGQAFNVDIEFSEAVVGFVQGDIQVGNGAVTGFNAGRAPIYVVEITPDAPDLDVTIDIDAGVAQDGATNQNLAAVQAVIPHGPPSAPRNLRAQAGDGQVTLSWQAPARAGAGAPITGYQYRQRAGANAFGAWLAVRGSDVNTRSYAVTGLTNNTRYTFEVRALNNGGSTTGVAASDSATPMAVVPLGITVSQANRTVAEAGGTATYTIVLNTQPTGNVTITPSSDDTSAATVSGALTFTTGNWNTAQTVTVTGVNDNIDNPVDRSATISHAVAGGGYGAVVAADVAVTVTDDDGVGITVSEANRTVAEAGGTATYTIVLNTQPTGNVVITPTSSDTNTATVSTALTFTTVNWNTAQTVTVTGVNDNIDNLNNRRSATITHAVAGGGYGAVVAANVAVTVTDDDGVGITVSQVARTVAEAGGTATYTIVLDSQPTGNVVITPRSSDATIATVSAALTFTTGNWNTAQTVTVTGVNDNIDNLNNRRSATITHAVAGGGYGAVVAANVAVTVTDDDGVGITVSEVARTVDEDGGTATYTLVLESPPTGNVTITPRSSDTDIATVSGALTFTAGNWDTAQTVTVTGVNDDIDNPNNRRSATITHNAAGGGYDAVVAPSVTVTVTDDDGAPQAEQRQQATQVTKTLTPEVSKVITSNLVSVLTDRLSDIGSGLRGFNLGNQSNVASLLKSHETAINNGEFELSQLLFNSGFSLSLEEESDSDLSIWGKGSYRDIAGGNTKRLKWDGRIESVSLGIDGYLDENTLMGVSVAASQARVEFTDYQSNAGKGDYDSDLSTISPYINWSWPKHSLWLMGSYGTGKIEQKLDQETVKRKADSRLISVATGGRMAIYQEQDNIAKGSSRVDIKAQASADRFKVKGSRDINEVDTNSRQLRMSVEGSHLYPSSAVSQLESKVELGVRYDGGEGETGWGSELGLGVGYSNRLSGFAIELNTRRLLTHTGDLEEWGVDGTITLKPGAQGYGPSFMWSMTRGYEELGNRLLEADSLSSLSANTQGTNYRTEIGYGIALPLQTQTMLTPYTAIDLLSTGSKKYALGMRLNVEEDVQLSLEGSQHKAETADDDRQIELQLKLLDW